MIGLAVGLAFGIVEFYFLTKLSAAFLKGAPNGFVFVLAKAAVLILALVIGVLLLRDQLVMLGVGLAAPLIVGSTFLCVKNAMKPGDKRKQPPAP